MSSPQTTESGTEASRAACYETLRKVTPPGTLAWIVEQEYQQVGPLWAVMILLQGEQGRWMRRRYRFDIPSETLYFAGEQPASEADLAQARRSGQRIK